MSASVPMWLAFLAWFLGGAIGLAVGCLFSCGRREDECRECARIHNAEKNGAVREVINFISDELKRPYVGRAR